MVLNENIYGDSTHQTSVAPSNVYSDHCKFSSIVPTLYAYATAYTKEQPLDNSVAIWQVADGSWKNGQMWFRRDGNGVVQRTTTKNINPQSLWLCVPVTFNLNHNLHMQNTAYNCELWNGDTTSQYYMSANSNKRAIITEFDYNRLQTRVTLYCREFDSVTKAHTGSSRTFNIYDYFKAGDGNGDYKDRYCIESVAITVCPNSGDTGNVSTEHRTSNSFAITAESGFSGSYVGRFYTNTPFQTPTPNNVYYDSSYMVYAQDSSIFGFQRTAITSIPQSGAFADSSSYRVEGINNADWVIDEWQEGSTNYIASRCIADYDTFMKQIAMFGFWFDESETLGNIYQVRLGEYCVSDNVCMPEIIGGRTTGNFKRGAIAAADPQAAWGVDWRDNVNYQGDRPYTQPDGDSGDLTSIFHRPAIKGSCNYYNFTSTNLKDLIDYLNTTYQPTDAQFINDFKGVNPSEYIASCMYYPDGFCCPNDSLTPVGVSIGALSAADTGITAHEADTSDNYITFGAFTIPNYYNDFRDYAPYTTIDLYVPFCGNIELDTAVFVGHTLNVYLLIDYPTGNCTAIVMRDGLVYDTLNGTCGVNVPLTAANMGQWQNAIKSAEIALKQAETQRKSAWLATAAAGASVVTGIATMNPLAIAGGVGGLVGAGLGLERANLSVESAQYQLTHTAASPRTISAASPANSICLDYDCHLLIKRPVMSTGYDSEIYGHTVGNACAINSPLKFFSGYTVCADVDLSGISAPAEIKTAILNTLKSGVYI